MFKSQKRAHFNLMIVIVIFFSISFISLGYSASNINLTISSELSVIPSGSITITNIVLISSENATESFSPSINDNSTKLGINVPSGSSKFVYEVTLKNNTDNNFHLSKINELEASSDITYLIMGLYIYDEIEPQQEITFQIVYEAEGEVPTNTNFILELEYLFGYGKTYSDPLLNGAYPELIDGLIPIVYDDGLKTWVKADVLNDEWYDYSIRKWANATSVVSSQKMYYVNAVPGTEVKMEHITSMMVWIPRFSYTQKEEYGYLDYGGSPLSITTPGAFDIKFVGTDTIDTGSASYTTAVPENYYTSSAFCWGNTCDDPATRSDPENVEIPGFWIAKFEASKVGELLYSKPNMTPMVEYSIADTFYYVQDLMNGMHGYHNYGYVGYVDAHLIKNTEWGAMAYLSQSKYGKYGNSDYEGLNKEIYPNNCLNYTTGIGADNPLSNSTTETCTDSNHFYDSYNGMGASTTGNIYGVYDTVGGTFDRVMGTVLTSSGLFNKDKSGFTELPEGRYINVYPYGNYGSTSTVTSIKASALTDTLGYYRDRGVTSIYLANSWFYRGGSLWSNATYINGIFSYTTYSGIADPNHSSRYTITIY